MKSLIYIALFSVSIVYGQREYRGNYKDGYRCIGKAEKKYDQGKFLKSLRLLDRADQMDYGFCGNAWMSASKSINTLRFNNYIELGEYRLARNYLDSINSFISASKWDSLRWMSFQLEFGADSLAIVIDTALENLIYVDSSFYHLVYIPLPDKTQIAKFIVDRSLMRLYTGDRNSVEAWKEFWIAEFKKTTIYAKIKRSENLKCYD